MSRWKDKYVIGLTGNIAVGKSVVRQMLQHLGAYPIDADALTHQAMAPGAPAYKPVVETFGRFIVGEDGKIDRRRLGAIAFALPEALTALEAAVHPVVRQGITSLISRAKQRVIVVEAIKLLEGDLAAMVDAVWVVDASQPTQIARLMEKRAMSADEARHRINVQTPQADKLARANVVIRNEGAVDETWRQVQSAWNTISASAPAQAAPPAQPTQAAVKPVAAIPSAPAAPSTTVAAPTPAPAAPAAAPIASATLSVRRAMPGDAEAIAALITRLKGEPTTRMDIMLAFGQKSFLLVYADKSMIGVAGWQVENLITRFDELYLDAQAPVANAVRELISAIEDASNDLQSEVCFIILKPDASPALMQAVISSGYSPVVVRELSYPAWREAAAEIVRAKENHSFVKQFRDAATMAPN